MKIEAYIRDGLSIGKEYFEILQLCSKELLFLHLRSKNSSLQAVRKKYQSPEHSSIHALIFNQWYGEKHPAVSPSKVERLLDSWPANEKPHGSLQRLSIVEESLLINNQNYISINKI